MEPNIKFSFEFANIDERVARSVESHLSNSVGSAIQKLEPAIAALNSLAAQGVLSHVDVDALIGKALSGEDAEIDAEPSHVAPANPKVKKAAKKATKKAAKKATKKAAKKKATKKAAKQAAKKAAPAAKTADSPKYSKSGTRLVRNPGVAGKPSREFVENVLEHMKKGDSDEVLAAKHKASASLLKRLRSQLSEGTSTQPEAVKADKPSSDASSSHSDVNTKERAEQLLKEGNNVVAVAKATDLSIPEINQMQKRFGL